MANFSDMNEQDFEALTDKKVNVVIEGTTVEGTVLAASDIGIVFKPKGASKGSIVPAAKLGDIEEVVAGPKKLRGRTIPQVHDGKYREHLIERHGYKITEIQAMSEDEAKAFHQSIDHSDLGHKHRELTPAELAIAEASTDEPDED